MEAIWKCIKSTGSFFALLLFFAGCVRSEYTKLVTEELEKGVRQDSLLFGIRLGDSQEDFFGKCYDLNQQQLITQGPSGSSVQYLFSDSSVHNQATRMRLLFYPTFDEKARIAEMKMEFSYQGWAPWNRALQSDSLQVKIMQMLELWYGGNEFIMVKLQGADVPVKVDGNRRILLDVKDAQSVRVMVQDMLHPMFAHSITLSKKEEE